MVNTWKDPIIAAWGIGPVGVGGKDPMLDAEARIHAAERYSGIKPPNSRWDNGWLISMISMGGYEMVQYPSSRPFVLSRAEWEALPEYRNL